MLRWLVRIGAVVAALAALAAISAWLVVRASLPTIDGVLPVEGLTAEARIERDADGIPTIVATTRADLAYATGFAHAQDRYFQMDLIRRRAAGELSALIGPATLDSDRRYRFHRFRSRAAAEVRSLEPGERALLEAYARGANAGLGSLSSRPFEYWLLGAEPAPWLAEDTVLVVYAMFMTLNDPRASRDVRRSYVRNVLPDTVYEWLYPDGTYWDAPIVGNARESLPVPGPDALSLDNVEFDPPGKASEITEPPIPGSNNWAVSGALTANGQAIVANDMHLGINVPNIYYQARLLTTGQESRDVMGVTLPGSPFVVAGSNEYMAWGYTNSYGDWSDAVLLRPGSEPDTYRTPDGDRQFERHVEVIEVKDAAPVEYTVRETIWGPVDEIDYPHGDIAVSWIAHKPGGVNLSIIDLETAQSVDEAIAVANTMGIPPQNFVTGDRDGNIAWTIAGRIPLRGDFDPLLPADWSDSEGWLGWLDPDAYPRVVNPDSGRIWTANTRVVDGESLRLIGDGGYDRGARGSQIRDGLLAMDSFTPLDMLAIQTDDRALFLTRWQASLEQLLSDSQYAADDEIQEFLGLVRDWVPRAAPEAVGYRLVRGFRLEVQDRLWRALMTPVRDAYGPDVDTWQSPQFEAALWQLVTEQPQHLLPQSYANWDEFLVDAVRGTIAYYDERYSTPLSQRTWGELNTARIQHPLSLAVPELSGWLDMPRDRLPGDADLPRAQGPGFGASERFAVSPGDRRNGIMHMPTGQSGHPMSPYYSRGHEDWVNGRSSPFLPGEAAHTLTLEPAP